jgi:hypothetical protein
MPGVPEWLKIQTYALPETHSTWHFFGYEFSGISSSFGGEISFSFRAMLLFGLVVVALPLLTFVALRATRMHAQTQAISALIGICLVGIFAEIIARLLVL